MAISGGEMFPTHWHCNLSTGALLVISEGGVTDQSCQAKRAANGCRILRTSAPKQDPLGWVSKAHRGHAAEPCM